MLVCFFSRMAFTSRSSATCLLAHDHALVDLLARADEELSALLELQQREGGGWPAAVGDQLTWLAACGSRPARARSSRRPSAAIPDPRVSVRNSVRKPIMPARGHEEVEPDPARPVVDHVLHAALAQREHLGDDAPRKSSGTSIESRSIGSCSLPPTSRVTTWGLPTVSSKPSRRIVSTSTASCSSPRPCTSQVSRRSDVDHADRHVPDQLPLEPVLHHARGQPGAGLARERRRC